MARLPDATTLQRRRASSGSPGISVRPLNTGVMAEGTRAIADGMRSLAGGMEAQMSADNDIKDYETKKRLLDFRLETETALEEHRRKMPAGGAGFADPFALHRRQAVAAGRQRHQHAIHAGAAHHVADPAQLHVLLLQEVVVREGGPAAVDDAGAARKSLPPPSSGPRCSTNRSRHPANLPGRNTSPRSMPTVT